MEKLTIWLQNVTGIPAVLYDKLFTSLAGIIVLWLVRRLLLKWVWRRTENYRVRYQWRKLSGYVAVAIGLLLIVRIWLEEFQSVVTFLAVVSAGLAIALRDPLVNVAGWFFIIWRRPFEVGDRIQIGDHSGDVIDQRAFQFTIMEIGNWVQADQSTGRIVHIPNGKVFTEPQINFTKGWFDYIWNEVAVLVTFESNWKKAKEILAQTGGRHAGHLTTVAEAKMKASARYFMIAVPGLAPTVYTSVEDSGVLLTLRYLCDPRRRRHSTEEIWEEVLERFAECDDVDFAYPTRRFYNNALEGKAEARAKLPDGQ